VLMNNGLVDVVYILKTPCRLKLSGFMCIVRQGLR
jgi:hypothetical protein